MILNYNLVCHSFKVSSDIFQYALPITTGLKDIHPKTKTPLKNLSWIITLIAIQRYGTKILKKLTQKKRPNGLDFESFPSGHIMIAAQCLTRSLKRDGISSPFFFLNAVGSISIALGRYLPGMHDVVDLTAGALLGVGLGTVWNNKVKLNSQVDE